jgi:hypothetical protein
MVQKKSSPSKKKLYEGYKLDNKVYKNKIKKMQRHCKRFPKDKEAQKNLERIEKEGYKGRTKPLIPGSNPPTLKAIRYIHYPGITPSRTAGEQLSELLGIPEPNKVKSSKPVITRKKKRNVKRS